MLHATGLIPDQLKTTPKLTVEDHFFLPEATTPRDSGYFSHTELTSQPDYEEDETEEESENNVEEGEPERRGLVMMSLDHQTGQQLVDSHRRSECDKHSLVLDSQHSISKSS